ncbi:Uma2 family endonuclease [Oscillochloris sp. ZM17-4]|uniref:Uma2 family endonuclease n=1 Tax=Oscillochloris sp. ZM17-4 TaxID=2866714 RepID=UPI0021052DAF|nr:Uma2 family endonuclease [Oscillochloris sp. ZM17-4]
MSMKIAGEETEIDLAILQGSWSVEQYLGLTDQTNRLMEYTDGVIEVLPMPTQQHQMILAFLYRMFFAFVDQMNGTVLFAPLRVQIRHERYREPDLMLLRSADDPRAQNRFWLGADLVVEIVSDDHPERDTVEKVADYAEAGIPEYWIVSPLGGTISVLTLVGDAYVAHGVFRSGERADSMLLDGFSVSVDEVFAAR